MAKPRNIEMESQIKALWAAGERNITRIAERAKCSRYTVIKTLNRTDPIPAPATPESVKETAFQKIERLWKTTELSRFQIAMKANCSASYVEDVTGGMPRDTGKLCKRPDIANGLEPCGRPRHRLPCGELLGVCQHHWEIGRPIGGQKSIISGKRGSKGY